MGIKVVFDEMSGPRGGKWTDTGEMMHFLKMQETFWNRLKMLKKARREPIHLPEIMEHLGYSMKDLENLDPELVNDINRCYWSALDDSHVDFGLNSRENQEAITKDSKRILIEFNCDIGSEATAEKKRCYFWKVYKYHVDASQISLKGWIDWCNELYQIQHGKPRPKTNRIFIDPAMTTATVKARIWNKDRIEQWLNQHGYSWTVTVETKYQWEVVDPNDVIFVDSDAEVEARRTKTA